MKNSSISYMYIFYFMTRYPFLPFHYKFRKMGYSWTGGRDAAKEGTWTWSNLTPFVYKNWMKHSTRKDEPNNSGGNENCLEMGQRGWNDLDCAKTRPFVCKFVKGIFVFFDLSYHLFVINIASFLSEMTTCKSIVNIRTKFGCAVAKEFACIVF